jgi:hypothetical protein
MVAAQALASLGRTQIRVATRSMPKAATDDATRMSSDETVVVPPTLAAHPNRLIVSQRTAAALRRLHRMDFRGPQQTPPVASKRAPRAVSALAQIAVAVLESTSLAPRQTVRKMGVAATSTMSE